MLSKSGAHETSIARKCLMLCLPYFATLILIGLFLDISFRSKVQIFFIFDAIYMGVILYVHSSIVRLEKLKQTFIEKLINWTKFFIIRFGAMSIIYYFSTMQFEIMYFAILIASVIFFFGLYYTTLQIFSFEAPFRVRSDKPA